jgi:hypothetical protein
MIRYALACAGGHEFEAWFRDSSDYDEQAALGRVECPGCGVSDVKKQVMAPAVATSRKREAQAQARTKAMAEAVGKVRQYIATNFDDVGDRFPAVARAIHDGLEPARGVYGQATPEEADALREEGVEVAPLPPILSPDFTKKIN